LPSTYTWSFGDGGTATTQNATHQYTDIGAYNVVFTITDGDGDFVSSQEVRYITVTWNHSSPVVIDESTSDVCEFYASDGDGSIGDPYIIENFTIDASALPGITINNTRHSLVFRNGTIDSTINATMIVNATTVTFTSCIFYYNATFSLDSAGITFTGNTFWNYFTVTGVTNWNFTDGQVMPVAYNGSVNDTASVYLNSVFGASTPDVVPVASFHVATAGTLYTLTLIVFHFDGTAGDAPITYNWTFGDGHSVIGLNPWHAYSAHSTYNVTLVISDKDGQNSTYSLLLTIHEKPDGGSGGTGGGDDGSGDSGAIGTTTVTTVVAVGAVAAGGLTLLVLSNYARSARPVAKRGGGSRTPVKRKKGNSTRMPSQATRRRY
jgi:PKD repeat protein